MDAPQRLQRLPSWLLSQAALNGDRHVSEAMAREGVRKYHYRVLVALADDGPRIQNDLVRALDIDRSDVTAAVTDLEARGLVERTGDPRDRRVKVVAITAEGEATLRRLDVLVDAAQETLLAPLSAKEREQLTKLLARLR